MTMRILRVLRNILPSMLVIALAVTGAFYYIQAQQPAGTDMTRIADLETVDKVVDVQAAGDDQAALAEVREMVMGAEDAPITIVEYASFTCPHCARFHEEVLGALKREYIDTGKVRFIVRDVYFDRLGLWAAMLARCDGSARKFFAISDLIYGRQQEWTRGESAAEIVANLMRIGRAAGLTDEQMTACLQDNDKARALVAAYQENAGRDEVNATPTFFINGKKYPNMSLDDFRATLDGILAQQQ